MSVISLDDARKKREKNLASKSQSKQTSASDEHGQTPTDDELDAMKAVYSVLALARMKPFTTKSALAREAATEVGLCASEGLISPRVNEFTFGNIWMITQDGLAYMEGLDELLSD